MSAETEDGRHEPVHPVLIVRTAILINGYPENPVG